jgi:hypothetical protein
MSTRSWPRVAGARCDAAEWIEKAIEKRIDESEVMQCQQY